MSRYQATAMRLRKLEAEAVRGKIATTDEAGNRAWVEGSGLRVAFNILKIQTELHKDDLAPSDLPGKLREKVSLWSRADATSQAEKMTKELCEGIMARGGEAVTI